MPGSYNGTSSDDGNFLNVANPVALNAEGTSWRQFLISLAVGVILFVVQFSLYQILRGRHSLRKIYLPKTYLVPQRQRTDAPSRNPLRWFLDVLEYKDADIIAKCGIDSYLFVRYLLVLLKIFVPALCLILPILLPLNAVGGIDDDVDSSRIDGPDGVNGTYQPINGLDRLGWQNVKPDNSNRLWAHCWLGVGMIIWCCYVIYTELEKFVQIRQKYLVSPQHRLRSSARTIFVPTIPPEFRSVKALDELFDVFPDGISKIWLNRDYTRLSGAIARRQHRIRQLEQAYTDMLRLAERKHAKKPNRKLQWIDGDPLWKRYVKKGERPSMHIPRFRKARWLRFLPFWLFWPCGLMKKVDTIDFCTSEIHRLSQKIDDMLQNQDQFPTGTSAFVQFNSQVAAHMAVQSNIHDQPAQMAPRKVEIAPNDIRWDNINIVWASRFVRQGIFTALFIGIILLWGLPITFAGFLSNISSTSEHVPWLNWINSLPSWAISAIQGVVPQLLVGLLITLLMPMLFRWLCGLTGTTSRAEIEIQLQGWYFAFVFIELVLVVSISAGIYSTIQSLLQNPIDVLQSLASNLPKVSNFFFSYAILQGLSISSAQLMQLDRLIYVGWRKMFSYTPRSEFEHRTFCPRNLWGSLFPLYTNFAVIGIIYSIVSPLILVFVTLQFSLFYVFFRNNIIYIHKNDVDTGGLLFGKALYQLFTGIYFLEFVLAALFFIKQFKNGDQACIAQGVIIVVMGVATIVFHINLYRKLQPCINYLPITLEDNAVLEDKKFAEQMAQAKSLAQRNKPEVQSDHIEEELQDGSSGSRESLELSDVRQSTATEAAKPSSSSIDVEKHGERAQSKARRQHMPKASHDMVHIGDVVGGFDDELEDLNADERRALVDEAFTDPVLRGGQWAVWIPADHLGIASDEIARMARQYGEGSFFLSTEGAQLSSRNHKVLISSIPPDYDRTWVVQKLL